MGGKRKHANKCEVGEDTQDFVDFLVRHVEHVRGLGKQTQNGKFDTLLFFLSRQKLAHGTELVSCKIGRTRRGLSLMTLLHGFMALQGVNLDMYVCRIVRLVSIAP